MIKIISDSSTLYSIEQGKKQNVEIAPLVITIDQKTYKEFEEIQTEQFIDIINEGHIPMSSQPSIGEVVELYEKFPNDEIINISMADGLSGTYNSACMAKEMVSHSENITVINSKTLCGPQRYLVDTAVKLVEEGKTKDEVVEVINTLLEQSKSYLIPNDFDFLVRGGRLSPLVGRIGGAIKLVPVMTLSEDSKKLEKFATKRTFTKAIQSICEALKEANVDDTYKLYITHACKEDLATSAESIIRNSIENIDIEIMLLSPAFTTQGGPGCVAIQVIKKYEATSNV